MYGCFYPENHPNHGWRVGGGEPDAYGLGFMGSASVDTPVVKMGLVGGREFVHDPDTERTTTFIVAGGNISLGPSSGFWEWMQSLFSEDGSPNPVNLGGTAYVAPIYNVDDVVNDYSGVFGYDTTTASWKIGATWGDAYHPTEKNIPKDERERSYSEIYGLTTGYSLTHDEGKVYYFPWKTEGNWEMPEYHIREIISLSLSLLEN